MKDLAERLRTLAEAIKACEWELPITASEDCLDAAKILDGAESTAEDDAFSMRLKMLGLLTKISREAGRIDNPVRRLTRILEIIAAYEG
jgi:hypothetical protein